MTAIKPVRTSIVGEETSPAPASLHPESTDAPFTEDAFAGECAMVRRLDGPPALSMPEEMHHAVRESGRGQMSLLGDIWRLARGPGRVSPQEYMYYRLWDPALDAAAKSRFVGKRVQTAVHRACNPATWFTLAHDKLIFQAVAAGFGLPVPRLRAIYHPTRIAGPLPQARDAESLIDLLVNGLDGPIFAKPIDGMYSIGALAIDRDAAGRGFRVNGHAVAAENLVRYLGFRESQGYLFQDRLSPHPCISSLIGDRLPTMRVLVLVDRQGCGEAVSAVVKLPAGAQAADNYWRADNLLGAVELETGTVKRAINGSGCRLEAVEAHPDTGVRLSGATLPQFDEAMALVRRAASAFPGIRTQSWDIALSDTGPVVMELNFGGDLNLHQLAHGRGIMGARYRAHVADCRNQTER
tara:strand:- start:739 stop:1968 length:1230 start_codon:yes stop_codon:yes gene_type:complete